MKYNSPSTRYCLFLITLASFIFIFSRFMVRYLAEPGSGIILDPPINVTISWSRHDVRVAVDDRERTIPIDGMAESPLYKEAVDRIPLSLRSRFVAIEWSRVLVSAVIAGAVAWWIIFKLWRPPST